MDKETELMKLCEQYYRIAEASFSLDANKHMGSIYALEERRSKIHDRILEITGLEYDDLYDITVNLINYRDWIGAYDAITKVWDRKKGEQNA